MTVSPTSLSVNATDHSETLSLSLSQSASWSASASGSWMTLSNTSGTGGMDVTVRIDANDTENSRAGTITFALKDDASVTAKVEVSQEASSNVSGDIVPNPAAFDGVKRASTTYQLLVYDFCDSDGDGVGDFKGIASRLDYLDALGVTALWLSPVHPSDSYHGYDVTDYTTVNPAFGTEEDFRDLVAAAKAKDIDIYLDYVLNHSGKGHPWFVDALAHEDSEYRDYYFFSADPSSDSGKGKYPYITSANATEWTLASGGAPDLTVTATQEGVTDGNSTWNLYYWNDKGNKTAKFVDDGDGTLHAVVDMTGYDGFLVRRYDNWDSGSKFGASAKGEVSLGEKFTLVSEGADMLISGDGRYRFEISNTTISDIYYLSAFSSWMPDLNYGEASTCEDTELFKSLAASADKWIEMGVEGLRLDAVKHIYGGLNGWRTDYNKEFLAKWYDHCNATYKSLGKTGDFFMVGEVFNEYNDSSAPYSTYLQAIPSVFNFSFWWRLNEALNNQNGKSFVASVLAQQKVYDGAIASTKLSNHDEERTGSILGKSAAKEKQAAAILLTASGKPFIYQGEELGYYGTKNNGDEYVRTPMNWDGASWADGLLSGKVDASLLAGSYSVSAQSEDDNSVLSVYETFSRIRNTYPALAEGTMSAYGGTVPSSIAAWYMTESGGGKALVVHNVGSSSATMSVSDDMSRPVALLGSASVSGKSLTLGANSSVVFMLQ